MFEKCAHAKPLPQKCLYPLKNKILKKKQNKNVFCCLSKINTYNGHELLHF